MVFNQLKIILNSKPILNLENETKIIEISEKFESFKEFRYPFQLKPSLSVFD